MIPLVAAALVGAALSAPASAAAFVLGGIEATYDPARWETAVVAPHDGAAAGLATGVPASLWFVCLAPQCRDRPLVWASATPLKDGEEANCSGIEGVPEPLFMELLEAARPSAASSSGGH